MKIEQTIFYKNFENRLYNLSFIYSNIITKDNFEDFSIIINIKGDLKDCFRKTFDIHYNDDFNYPFYLLIPELFLGEIAEIIIAQGNKVVDRLEHHFVKQKKWTILLTHHSHTDIGYTKIPESIEVDYYYYYKDILKYCNDSSSDDYSSKFKWNCENLWQVENFFNKASKKEIEEFIFFEKNKQIEVCGGYFNFISDLLSEIEFIKSLNFLEILRKKYNIFAETSMITDVCGIPYFYPKYFPLYGIKFLNVSPHNYCGKPIKIQPPFYWRYKENGKILIWKSDDIHTFQEGTRLGFNGDYLKSLKELPKYLKDRQENGYMKDYITLKVSGAYEDNAPPNFNNVKVVKKWNEEWAYPVVKNSLNKEVYHYILNNDKNIEERIGIWSDWWIASLASAPREVAITRDIKRKLLKLERSLPVLSMIKKIDLSDINNRISNIYSDIIYSDEHTAGSSFSVMEPDHVDSKYQYLNKSLYAYRAAAKFYSLLDEIVKGELIFNEGETEKVFYLYNSNNFNFDNNIEIESKIVADIDLKEELIEFTVSDCLDDFDLKCQHEKINKEYFYISIPTENFFKIFFKVKVESYSLKKIKVNYRIIKPIKIKESQLILNFKLLDHVIENDFYKLKFNELGQIIEVLDKDIKENIIDICNFKFNEYVYDEIKNLNSFIRCRHESLNGFDPKSIIVNKDNVRDYWDLTPEKIKFFRKKNRYTPTRQTCNFLGIDKLEKDSLFSSISLNYNHRVAKKIKSIIRLYNNEKKIEIINSLFKIGYYHPHAIFYAFPFNIDNFKILLSNSDTVVNPKEEQLPGSSTDWYQTSGYICLYNNEFKILFYQQDAFVVCFNDINFGKWTDELILDKPYIFSNIYNNYVETNFYPVSHGILNFRYIIQSNKIMNDKRDNSDLLKYQLNIINELEVGLQPIFEIKDSKGEICTYKSFNISKENVKIALISFNSGNNMTIMFEETAGRACEFHFTLFTRIKSIECMSFLNKVKEEKIINSNSFDIKIKKFETLKINLRI